MRQGPYTPAFGKKRLPGKIVLPRIRHPQQHAAQGIATR